MWIWIFFLVVIAVCAFVAYKYIPEEFGTSNALLVAVGGFIGALILIVLINYIPITTWTGWLQNGKGLVATALSAVLGWLGIQSFRSGTFTNFTQLLNLSSRRREIAELEHQQLEAGRELIAHLAPLETTLGTNPTAVAAVRNVGQQLETLLQGWEQSTTDWEQEAHDLNLTTMEGLTRDAHDLAHQHRADLATQMTLLVPNATATVIATAIAEMRRIIGEERPSADHILNEAGASTGPHSQPIAGSIMLVLALISLIFGGFWTTQSPPTPPQAPFERLAEAVTKAPPGIIVAEFIHPNLKVEILKFSDPKDEEHWRGIAAKELKNPKVTIDKVVKLRFNSNDGKTITGVVVYYAGKVEIGEEADPADPKKTVKKIEEVKEDFVPVPGHQNEKKTNEWVEDVIERCNNLAPIGGAANPKQKGPPIKLPIPAL